MGYEKEAYLYLLFLILRKKDFQESTPNIQMLMCRLDHTPHFGLWDIPLESQLALHIYYVNFDNTLTCKGISWDLGECFKNIFLFPICIIQKVAILAPKIKPYIHGNS